MVVSTYLTFLAHPVDNIWYTQCITSTMWFLYLECITVLSRYQL